MKKQKEPQFSKYPLSYMIAGAGFVTVLVVGLTQLLEDPGYAGSYVPIPWGFAPVMFVALVGYIVYQRSRGR